MIDKDKEKLGVSAMLKNELGSFDEDEFEEFEDLEDEELEDEDEDIEEDEEEDEDDDDADEEDEDEEEDEEGEKKSKKKIRKDKGEKPNPEMVKLMAEIKALRSTVSQNQKGDEDEDDIDKVELSDINIDLSNIIKDEDDITDKGVLKKVVNLAAQTAYEAAIKKALSESMKRIPKVINNVVGERMAITEKVKQFYADNDDLVPHKSYVSVVANEISARHPDLSYDELFTKTGREVRKRLGLKKTKSKSKKRSKHTPAPKGKSLRAQKKAKPNSLQKQIKEML